MKRNNMLYLAAFVYISMFVDVASGGFVKIVGHQPQTPLMISESFPAGMCFDSPVFVINETSLSQSLAYSTPSPTIATPVIYIWRFFDPFGSRHLIFQEVNQTAASICIQEPVNMEDYRVNTIRKVTFGVAAALDGVSTQLHFINSTIDQIWLINTNDVPPRFVNVSSTVSRVEEGNYENRGRDFCVTRFRVVDEDFSMIPAELTVVIKSTSPPTSNVNPSPKFQVICNSSNNVDSNSAARSCCLAVTGVLDFEAVQSYVIELEVSDGIQQGQQPVLTDQLELVIIVVDTDDTPPVFSAPIYSAVVPEDTKTGTEIVRISARDGDMQIANPITYSIISVKGGDTFLSYFAIDPKTGAIRLAKPIDREASDIRQLLNAELKLQVEARETKRSGPGKAFNSTSIVPVIITVADVDDHDPIFSSLNYSLTAVWTPGLAVWTVVSSGNNAIRVTDLDEHTNAAFRLTIKSADDGPLLFNVLPPVATETAVAELIPTDNETLLQSYIGKTWSARVTAEAVFPNSRGQKRSSTVPVTVSVQPANTEAPRFEKKTYNFEVTENAEHGAFVGKIFATDTDHDRFGVVTYIISASSPAETSPNVPFPFDLHPLTGALTVNVGDDRQVLDREKTPEYLLFVTAVDGGGLSDSAIVRIRLSDINDNGPVFLPTSCSDAFVPEETIGIVPNCIFHVFDPDASPNNDSIVRISSVNLLLNVVTTGEIPDPPNNALVGVDSFRLIKHGDGSDSSKWELQMVKQIDVDKLRTHVPSFGDNNGVTVLVGLRVEDTNTAVYQPPFYSDSLVRVTFTDINDNAPECLGSNEDGGYYFEVLENVTSTEVLATIKTSDADDSKSVNAKIVFSWTMPDQDSENLISYQANPFTLNPENGEIRLSPGNGLDKDIIAMYNLSVRFQDLGSPPQNTTCLVVIKILDVNNKPPRFSPSATKYLSITENSAPEKFLAVMSAEDPDVDADLEYSLLLDGVAADFGPNWTEGGGGGGSTSAAASKTNSSIPNLGEYQNDSLSPMSSPLPNGATMGLTPAPPVSASSAQLSSFVSKLFSFDKRNGFVQLLRPLDREVLQAIKLPIVVRDLNADPKSQPQTATGTLVIQVLDVNDSPPRFDRPDAFYYFEVRESTTVGSRIGSVKCIDADSDDATFIEVGPWGDRHSLDVTPIGDVVITKPLDFEKQRQLNITVTCTDRASHRATAVVAVTVLDDNDCVPHFTDILSDDAYAVVAESSTPGTLVRKMEASDCDSGEYGMLAYFIVAGNEKGHFNIDTHSGEVTVAGVLDAEAIDNYELTILVKDNPYTILPNQSHKATKRLQIAVSDINDCSPTFTNHPVWLGEISIHDLMPGVTLKGTPVATDCDKTSNNSAIKYSIVQSQAGGPEIFNVDRTTGRVFVALNVDREMLLPAAGSLYSFNLKASDTGRPVQLSGVATISLTIVAEPGSKVGPENLLKTALSSAIKEMATDEDEDSDSSRSDHRKRIIHFTLKEGYTGCLGQINAKSTIPCCKDFNYTLVDSTHLSHFKVVQSSADASNEDGAKVELCVVDAFDREKLTPDTSAPSVTVELKLEVRRADNCPSSCPPVLEEIAVFVEVLDVDDNAPIFRSSTILGRGLMPALVREGQFVVNLKDYLFDQDSKADFSNVHFSLSPYNTGRHHVEIFKRLFNLDNSSGIIKTLPFAKRATPAMTAKSIQVLLQATDLSKNETQDALKPNTVLLTIPVVENVSSLVDVVVRLPMIAQSDVFQYGHSNVLPETDQDRQMAKNFTSSLNEALLAINAPFTLNEAGQTLRLHPMYSDHHLLHVILHAVDSSSSVSHRSTNTKRTAVNTAFVTDEDSINGRALVTALTRAYRETIPVAKVFSQFPVVYIYPVDNTTNGNGTSNDFSSILSVLGNMSVSLSHVPDVYMDGQHKVEQEGSSDEAFSTYMSWAFLSIVIVSFLTMSILILVAAFVVFRQKYHRKMRALEILLTADTSSRHHNHHHQSHHRPITAISSNGCHPDDNNNINNCNGGGQYFDSRTLPAIIKAAGSIINETAPASNNNNNNGNISTLSQNNNHNNNNNNSNGKGVTRVHYNKASSHHLSTSDKNSNGTGLLDNFRAAGLFTTFLRPVASSCSGPESNYRAQQPVPEDDESSNATQREHQQQLHKPRRLFTFSDDNVGIGTRQSRTAGGVGLSGTGRSSASPGAGGGAGAGAGAGGVSNVNGSRSGRRTPNSGGHSSKSRACNNNDQPTRTNGTSLTHSKLANSDSGVVDDGNFHRTVSPVDGEIQNGTMASPTADDSSYSASIIKTSLSSHQLLRSRSSNCQQQQSSFDDHIAIDEDYGGGSGDMVGCEGGCNSSNNETAESDYHPLGPHSKFPYIDSTVTSTSIIYNNGGSKSNNSKVVQLMPPIAPPPLIIGNSNGTKSVRNGTSGPTAPSGYVYTMDVHFDPCGEHEHQSSMSSTNNNIIINNNGLTDYEDGASFDNPHQHLQQLQNNSHRIIKSAAAPLAVNAASYDPSLLISPSPRSPSQDLVSSTLL